MDQTQSPGHSEVYLRLEVYDSYDTFVKNTGPVNW